jgi:hypothetical protein
LGYKVHVRRSESAPISLDELRAYVAQADDLRMDDYAQATTPDGATIRIEEPERMFGSVNPRRQGDLGEYSAVEWLGSRGYPVWIPFGHSPDCDLVTEIGGRLVRVQVKTSTLQVKHRFQVALRTNGGNQKYAAYEVEPGRPQGEARAA